MPPAKKKPAARAKPSARAKAPVRKTVVKKSARKSAKRATTPRASERRRVSLRPDLGEQPSGARPVAVGSARALWETDDIAAPTMPPRVEPPPARDAPPDVDKPLTELGVAVCAALLAASVFLPWYHNVPSTVSGWASGTWGPIIFFLALAAVAIVVLRRAQIAIAFPIEPTLVVEGIGWVCVIGLILKRYFSPSAFGFKLPTDGWLFASLGLALALALLAGIASKDAAFVLRPGWWKGTPGKIGASVLVITLAGGLVFGFTNTAVSTSIPKANATPPAITTKGLPPCAKRIHLPTPNGFTAAAGSEIPSINHCDIQYASSLPLVTGFDRFVAALRGAGWTVTAGRSSPVYRLATLGGRTCGTLTIAQTRPKTLVALVSLNVCPPASK